MFDEPISFNHRPLCSRFRVGAELVRKLVQNSLTFCDMHQDYIAPTKQLMGSLAQHGLFTVYRPSILVENPLVVNTHFPFLYATADAFCVDAEGKPFLIKVTSAPDEPSARKNAHSLSTRLQLRAALDTLNATYACVFAVKRTEFAFDSHCWLHSYKLASTSYLFKNRRFILDGYVKYLNMFFECAYSLALTEDTCALLRTLLEQTVPYRNKKDSSVSLEAALKNTKTTAVEPQLTCFKAASDTFPHGLTPEPSLPAK